MPDWQAILSREGPAVWQTAYKLLGNSADADECFQEAFLAALEVSRREPVQCWHATLRRLAVARAVDCLRQRRRRDSRKAVADLDSVQSAEPAPSQSAEDQELAQRLRAALARIPPQQADVFCLYCLEGESYQDIARQLAISTS